MLISEQIEKIFTTIQNFWIAIFQPFIDLIIKLYLDNPMLKIVFAFVPGLMGLAYPLIVQTISKLNDQYSSTHIINQFKKELKHKWFSWNLKISVFLTILCFTLSLNIFLLAFISVIFLIISFFYYLRLLMDYQSGQDLFNLYNKRLKIDFDTTKKRKKDIVKQDKLILDLWYPIIDLFLYSINKDRRLENDIRDLFIYRAFRFYQDFKQDNDETTLYPPELYNSTFDIIHNYIKSDEKDYYQNIETFIGSIYFTDTFEKENPKYLHQETFAAIWRNLVLIVEHNRGDKLFNYWKAAHQYCRFQFTLQLSMIAYDDVLKRAKLKKYRDEFVQFHTVIGAYVMYKKDCKTLNELWSFTQSEPPEYVLIPQSTDEIFNLFIAFLTYEFYNSKMVFRYWFKDLDFDEMNNKTDVKIVVCQYTGLLFLRLYLIRGFWPQHPLLTFPQIPKQQSEKKIWEEKLDKFKDIVKTLLEDSDFLKCLHLDVITPEWCAKNNFKTPIDYIDELKRQVKEGYEKELNEAALDTAKTDALDKNTVDYITSAFKDISRVKGSDIINKNEADALSNTMEVVRGTRLLLNREAFISNTAVHHINADTILGEIIKENYYNHFSLKIFLQKKKRYNVPNGRIFDAIDRLQLSLEKYIIISFGLNIKYLRDYQNVIIEDSLGEENYRYKSSPIYCFSFSHPLTFGTIYIIEKKDLPMIKHKDWSEIEMPNETQDRWKGMTLIDKNLKIYRKFTELNTDKKIKDEYIEQGKSEDELKNMIEVDVDFLGYCWFKKDIEIIEIKESELFKEGGNNIKIEDINPIV